jgi:hypothetical protein
MKPRKLGYTNFKAMISPTKKPTMLHIAVAYAKFLTITLSYANFCNADDCVALLENDEVSDSIPASSTN